MINRLTLTGKKAVYTLAIPKGDTNIWEDQEVIFFNERWRVFGIPLQGIEELNSTWLEQESNGGTLWVKCNLNLNRKGVADLMKSAEMQTVLKDYATSIKK